MTATVSRTILSLAILANVSLIATSIGLTTAAHADHRRGLALAKLIAPAKPAVVLSAL